MSQELRKKGDKEILICDCKSIDHQITFIYDDQETGGVKYPLCYVLIHLNHRPLLERIKYGFKYIFGFKSKYGAFDEFVLSPQDSPKINSLLTYLESYHSEIKWDRFLTHVKKLCEENKVELELSDDNFLQLSDNIKCGGYFDSEIPKLACSMGNKNAKELLIHEYCHLTQWIDKIPLWEKSVESLFLIDEWIANKRVKNIKKHINLAKELELDNEKRVVKTIVKWDLDINIHEYTKKANAYVLFYLYLQKSRKWTTPGNSPYENKKILSFMSDKFDMNYEKLDPPIMKIFREELN